VVFDGSRALLQNRKESILKTAELIEHVAHEAGLEKAAAKRP